MANDMMTALVRAAKDGDGSTIMSLLRTIGSADMQTREGAVALLYASASTSRQVVEAMLSKGIDANVRVADSTPLIMAAKYCNLETLSALLQHGANIGVVDEFGEPPLVIVLRKVLKYGCVNWDQCANVVQILLNAGCNANAFGKMGAPALVYACALSMARTNAPAVIVRELLEHGADPNLNQPYTASALHHAVCHLDPGMAHDLIGAGANVNAIGTEGCTPLTVAVLHHRHDAMRALLAAGADPILRRGDGLGPLDIAALHGDQVAAGILASVLRRREYGPEVLKAARDLALKHGMNGVAEYLTAFH